jgi:hypothetical protein
MSSVAMPRSSSLDRSAAWRCSIFDSAAGARKKRIGLNRWKKLSSAIPEPGQSVEASKQTKSASAFRFMSKSYRGNARLIEYHKRYEFVIGNTHFCDSWNIPN